MSATVTLSGLFMGFAREALCKCLKDGKSRKVMTTPDNNYSHHALTVYIMAVTALESFFNEVFFGSSKRVIKSKIALEILEDMDIRTKYYLTPQLLWGKTFDRGAEPYQSFNMLVTLRNYLIHYKMKGCDEKNFFKYLKTNKLIINTATHMVDVDAMSNTKAALWAYNTACHTAYKLMEFADENTKKLWCNMLSNFQEINSADVSRQYPILGMLDLGGTKDAVS